MSSPRSELSWLTDVIPPPGPEVRQRVAARLATLVEVELLGGTASGFETRRRRWTGQWSHRLTVVAVAAAILVVFFVPLPHLSLFNRLTVTSPTGALGNSGPAVACTTTVHGVIAENASVVIGFLPSKFQLSSGNPANLGAGTVTYSLKDGRPDPPRVAITLSNLPGPLTPTVGGMSTASSVRIQGHEGLLETGPADPAFISAYWKLDATNLVSVVGYKLPGATVLKVARHTYVSPAGLMTLPVSAGRIIDRTKAIAIVRAEFPHLVAVAKLSSWSEVLGLIRASGYGKGLFTVPAVLTAAPWRPIWALLLTPRDNNSTQRAPSNDDFVILNAATGATELTAWAGDHSSWFSHLTDRDPGLRGCPGGSSARLPFGVLTRDEEIYTLGAVQRSAFDHLRTTFVVKLTTVPVLNRADPGLYGGCVEQSCSIDELVWPTIEVMRAAPGKTLSCPPPWVSTPAPGVHSHPTKQYFVISVPDNYGSGCGALPGWVSQLRDLAPPSRT